MTTTFNMNDMTFLSLVGANVVLSEIMMTIAINRDWTYADLVRYISELAGKIGEAEYLRLEEEVHALTK